MMLKVILTLIPFVWFLVMFPFVNRVHPMILGLPFLAFWMAAGVLVTVGCIAIMRRYDDRDDRNETSGK